MAQPGDTISVDGNRLSDKIKVVIGEEKIKLDVDTSKLASFDLPSNLELGLTEVEFTYAGDTKKSQKFIAL